MTTQEQKEKWAARLKFLEEFLPTIEATLRLAVPPNVSHRLRGVLLSEVDGFRMERASLEALLKKG